MKKRIMAAIMVVLINITAYPLLNRIATAERGYEAIGGEEVLIIFGFVLALYILMGGFSSNRRKK